MADDSPLVEFVVSLLRPGDRERYVLSDASARLIERCLAEAIRRDPEPKAALSELANLARVLAFEEQSRSAATRIVRILASSDVAMRTLGLLGGNDQSRAKAARLLGKREEGRDENLVRLLPVPRV